MNQQIPQIDLHLIEYLEKIYLPTTYDSNKSSEELARTLAFNAGCLEVIAKLKALYTKQRKN